MHLFVLEVLSSDSVSSNSSSSSSNSSSSSSSSSSNASNIEVVIERRLLEYIPYLGDPLKCDDSSHTLIQAIIDINPSSVMHVCSLLQEHMPHYRMQSETLVAFISNALMMIDYVPVLTQAILELCVNMLISLDVSFVLPLWPVALI